MILPAGVPLTVPVTITNTGAAPEAFFIDARLNTTTSLPLAELNPVGSGFPLPLPATTFPPVWLVPTQTSSVQAAANRRGEGYDQGPNARHRVEGIGGSSETRFRNRSPAPSR